MNIEIAGHSGCIIEVVNTGSDLRLIKRTGDCKYASRLKDQAEKQDRYSRISHNKIKIPQILGIDYSEGHCRVEMEYVYSKNFIDFFETSDVYQIDSFIDVVFEFIDSLIIKSTLQKIPLEVIKIKYEDVYRKISESEFLNKDEQIKELLCKTDRIFQECRAELSIPVGYCHGDLTLSNILFNGYNYYLIDFLDSFIESPLMDIVKLRQDTYHMWSVLMFSGKYNKPRLNLIMNRIEIRIEERYGSYSWYRDYYAVFQLMNFLRILQYAHEPLVIDYLKKNINNILSHEFQLANSCSN